MTRTTPLTGLLLTVLALAACANGSPTDSSRTKADGTLSTGSDTSAPEACDVSREHAAGLTPSCNAVATAVCAADDYCCRVQWDARCVGLAAHLGHAGAGGSGGGGGEAAAGGIGGAGSGGGVGGDGIADAGPSLETEDAGSADSAPGSEPTTACSVEGRPGECILVSDCEAMPGYSPTAGHCPGPTNIQCCTLGPSLGENPPFPAGYKLMTQSAVTTAMTAWAVSILDDPADYPMFSTTTKMFGSEEVLAEVLWHPPDFQNGVIHRGVTLFVPTS